jgi:nitroimidazol reductase NimA-like FMN-containing flavoprotein (pyridoxamine 5'-phosphate oxidase superfamily)
MGEHGLQHLDREDCLRQLALGTVGRIAFMADTFPVVLPVNYQLVDVGTEPMILVRTTSGGAIAHAPLAVAFEVDGIDLVRETGWSVLVQGAIRRLGDVEAEQLGERVALRPWASGDRTTWLAIVPIEISGRRLVDVDALWSVDVRAYL